MPRSLGALPEVAPPVNAGSDRPDAVTAASDVPLQPIPREEQERALELLRVMGLARQLDRVEMELVNRGEAFFHVGGAGHESSAALARHLLPADWLHLHYRDKALMLARGLPPAQFLHSLLCTAESHSAGRQMSAHLSAPELHVLSLVGPVGNNALQAVGVALEVVARHTRDGAGHPLPLVVCALGDGTTQQGEVLEALAEAARSRLPLLFLVEDNGLAISTSTRARTFFDRPGTTVTECFGIPIHRLDGRDAWACDQAFARLVGQIRSGEGPLVAVMRVERLTHHTNADDERVYRSDAELSEVRAEADPLLFLTQRLLAGGVPLERLTALLAEAEGEVRSAVDQALAAPNPQVQWTARPPWAAAAPTPALPGPTEGRAVPMLEALREVLRGFLAADPDVSLYGEDIEDPKGDVFGLTRGLSRSFPGRVVNSALSESTIVGVSIGRALAGGRPIAFIQFADFLPLAFNQIASELASLWWRTDGGWTAPVVILAPCGGYRPGLGPFHAQTFEATFAHLPGLDVVMPANAEDAAGLLRGAFAGRRPTLFLYPKVLLNDAAAATRLDVGRLLLEPGRARVVRTGDDLTLVGWGATVSLCVAASDALATAGVACGVIDLRCLSPWDQETVLAAARRSRRVVVVHEDNLSAGFGAEVIATVAEHAGVPVELRRVARPDTHVPCNYVNQLEVLPSLRRILAVAAPLCGVEVRWPESVNAADEGVFVLEAVGSSPADQNVTVIEWKVREGSRIAAGELLAECEADKATFDLRAPVAGIIRSLRAPGETVTVGTPLARIEGQEGAARVVRRVPPVLTPEVVRIAAPVREPSRDPSLTSVDTVGLTGIAFVTGSVRVDNVEMAARFPGRSPLDIVQRTGIETRYYCGPDETVLTLAVRAARGALEAAGLGLPDLDAIVVSTSTPLSISPSLACRLHHELSRTGPAKDVQAVDLLAACSGWLYALQTAHDLCRTRPEANVLVVTAEAMSHFLNPQDFDTAIVFGDAATATVVRGAVHRESCRFQLRRPLLSARGEDGSILNLGRLSATGCSPVEMHGVKVFPLAVRQMNAMLQAACVEAGWKMADLDWIVPHQANGRIIAAAQQRSGVAAERVVSNVARYGNTSSSSIPIALAELAAAGKTGRVGLAAFGGGFTFGAAVVEVH
jgi:2-oxoisovalerate dehydrogenase E1 component